MDAIVHQFSVLVKIMLSNIFIVIYLLFGFINSTNSDLFIGEDENGWKDKWQYYHQSLDSKMKAILSKSCSSKYEISLNSPTDTSKYNSLIAASNFSPSNEVIDWWKKVKKPLQMRVESWLCDSIYLTKSPYFEREGCPAKKGYMSTGAPRCQVKYLKHVCDSSKMNVEDRRANGFFLPEANHNQSFTPPLPFLLGTKNAFVTM